MTVGIDNGITSMLIAMYVHCNNKKIGLHPPTYLAKHPTVSCT